MVRHLVEDDLGYANHHRRQQTYLCPSCFGRGGHPGLEDWCECWHCFDNRPKWMEDAEDRDHPGFGGRITRVSLNQSPFFSGPRTLAHRGRLNRQYWKAVRMATIWSFLDFNEEEGMVTLRHPRRNSSSNAWARLWTKRDRRRYEVAVAEAEQKRREERRKGRR